ncbi:unnamed protein product [Callosobruchus maculatus]|uniref:Uncharacterized protein n=1 Tax=Callosobruchus maculatus TaxID=64391 RepID=A0A653CFA3_CALMS|nr:unnamed protein product [Callosobruchus maculatus]
MYRIRLLCIFVALTASSIKCVVARTAPKASNSRLNLNATLNEVATVPKGKLLCFSLSNSSFGDRIYIPDNHADLSVFEVEPQVARRLKRQIYRKPVDLATLTETPTTGRCMPLASNLKGACYTSSHRSSS